MATYSIGQCDRCGRRMDSAALRKHILEQMRGYDPCKPAPKTKTEEDRSE